MSVPPHFKMYYYLLAYKSGTWAKRAEELGKDEHFICGGPYLTREKAAKDLAAKEADARLDDYFLSVIIPHDQTSWSDTIERLIEDWRNYCSGLH